MARMEEGRGAFKIFTVKPTGERPLGRPRCIWEVNIRMDLEDEELIPISLRPIVILSFHLSLGFLKGLFL